MINVFIAYFQSKVQSKKFMSLRIRFNLLITLIMLFFIIALSLVMMNISKKSIQEGVESANRVTMQLLDTVIISSVQNPEWGNTHMVMKKFLEELGYVRSNDIYLYDLQNNLLYQTPKSTYRLNISPPKWFINYLAPPEEVNSRLIRFGRLIVSSNPSGAIREIWAEMSSLFFTTIIFFLLLNFLVYWMLGKWLRPINPMIETIEKMSHGDLSARIPDFEIPEFSAIAKNFNTMGVSLENKIRENKKLVLIAEQTADAVMIHDKNLKISFWNSSAERIFGYTKNEILGKSSMEIVPKSLIKEIEKDTKNKINNFETKRKSKSGKLINVSISVSQLIDPSTKNLLGHIVSMRDITERLVAEKSKMELKQNRRLTMLIQQHVEDERRSLARELHDELGQYVSAIKIFAQNISKRTRGKDAGIKTSAASVTSAANQIYDGMQNIIRQLRPGSLDNLGLSETLRDTVSRCQSQHLNLKFILNIKGNIDSLGEMININVYRIIQEAMNNALKHAEASTLKISLIKIKRKLCIEFNDDGKGFDVSILKSTKQFGLIGIKERVQALNGSFEIQSTPKNGTNLKIVILTKN